MFLLLWSRKRCHHRDKSNHQLNVQSASNNTLGPAYNEQKDAKEIARYKWVLVVTELFNIAVNYIHAKKSVCHCWVLVVAKLVVSGTQCNCW